MHLNSLWFANKNILKTNNTITIVIMLNTKNDVALDVA